jgi:phosphomethylpyrimidine synthase
MSERNGQLPNSKKIHVSGKLHPDIRVPFREISLAPTKSMNGEIEINEPVRVYDTSGAWGDADFHGDVKQGLPLLRSKWIRERSDVEEYDGRRVQPIDDGYLSESHAERAERKRPTPNAQRRSQRARTEPVVIQCWMFGVRRSVFPEEFFARSRTR